jgi:hypothetical protein
MNKQIKENEEITEKSRKFLRIAKSQIFLRGLMQKNIPKKQKN